MKAFVDDKFKMIQELAIVIKNIFENNRRKMRVVSALCFHAVFSKAFSLRPGLYIKRLPIWLKADLSLIRVTFENFCHLIIQKRYKKT